MNRQLYIPPAVFRQANVRAIEIIRAGAQKSLQAEFDEIKSEMINEFLMHPVTQEIQAGPNAPNISETLSRGNLFSFIGFESGSDPIAEILNIMESSEITFYSRRRGEFIASIRIPSAQVIFNATPMPWAIGRSWAKGIESGISGLGFYLHVPDKGRSEGGVQSRNKVQAGSFKNTSYISALLSKYSKKFSSIKGVKVIIK